MINVAFINAETGSTTETELSAEELRILNDLKPKLLQDGDEYKIMSIEYSIDSGMFTIYIEQMEEAQ